jgi:hypothetical protein
MSDSDSGASSSTRLSVFKGRVNDSYPHYRITLISLLKRKGLYFLIERGLEANPTLFVGEDCERNIITASNIIVQSLGRTPLSIAEEFLESPGQMQDALDNCYRGATTTDIILSLNEIHKVFWEENDMSTFLDDMGSLFANLKAMKCGLADIVQVGLLLAKILKKVRSMQQQPWQGYTLPIVLFSLFRQRELGWFEQQTVNLKVMGSNPILRLILLF